MSKRPTSSRAEGAGGIPAAQVARLRPLLEAVVRSADRDAQLAVDPIAAVHRYPRAADQEIAGVFASVLAFGRVAAFRPVVGAILDTADAWGGPRAFVEASTAEALRPLAALQYRWMRGPELQVLARALGRVVRTHGSLGAAFPATLPFVDRLGHGVTTLRAAVRAETGAAAWSEVSRGLRYMLPHPSGGSACKRWCMFLRWMVRPPSPNSVAGLDLGLWPGDPAGLVIPLDTHVLRISQLVGLTRRRDASWRTAVDVTAQLARVAPSDPLRYDFALAHLGISGGCSGRYVPTVCSACGLRSACRVVEQACRTTG